MHSSLVLTQVVDAREGLVARVTGVLGRLGVHAGLVEAEVVLAGEALLALRAGVAALLPPA